MGKEDFNQNISNYEKYLEETKKQILGFDEVALNTFLSKLNEEVKNEIKEKIESYTKKFNEDMQELEEMKKGKDYKNLEPIFNETLLKEKLEKNLKRCREQIEKLLN